MDILLSESQVRVILLEDAKDRAYEILTKKIGLNERFANEFVDICGGLSVIMFNKMFAEFKKRTNDTPGENRDLDYMEIINRSPNTFFNVVVGGRQNLIGIMDWIRVGLNGNFKPYQNITFSELIQKSKEWHDSLEVGTSKFDFKEDVENIIIDYRDENGYGYYWVNLNKSFCDDEAERMGHCARSSGNLYSFRQYLPVPGGKHSLNKSLLTASITSDGTLLQLKGAKNSKPEEKYYSYIEPLFLYVEDGKYLITKVGSEYASNQDFSLSDLPDDEIKYLFEKRPELFNNRKLKKKLVELGLSEKTFYGKKVIHLDNHEISKYVKGGWKVNKNHDIFEYILSGDLWGIWEPDWGSIDVTGAIRYYMDDNNKSWIFDYFKKQQGENFDPNLSLDEMMDEYSSEDIDHSIRSAVSDCERQDYEDYLWNQLKSALEEYGKVVEMSDRGVDIEIDYDELFSHVGEDYLDDAEDSCDNEPNCMFTEFIYNGDIDKPDFDIDDRWYPDVDHNNFNEILRDRLNEI